MKTRVIAAFLVLVLVLAAAVSAAAAEENESIYELVDRSKGVYRLKGTDYYVMDYRAFTDPEATVKQAESFTSVMSQYPEVKTYVYFVTSFRSVDFDHMAETPEMYTLIRENYPDSTTGYLKLDSVEDYCRLFYRTDHHWNYLGSYEGYKQIIGMLLGEDEPLLEPVETVTFPVYFNGSLFKEIGRKDSDEQFTVYRFDYPEMTIRINGVRKKNYGLQSSYFDGKYSSGAYANHYGQFYGGDVGLIEISTGDESKGNLLVIANSLSNAVDLLLASHYNNTYFVDLRHYSKDMGSLFSLSGYVKKWNISQVLMLGDGHFFTSGATYR